MENGVVELIVSIISQIIGRFLQLLQVPINNSEILWAAIPLLIATFFVVTYFGKYRKEHIGWNDAFGNSMVFLFMAINLIKEMYYQDGVGSITNILSNKIYLPISVALIITGAGLMILTYYRILPKNIAFFMFSAPTVNSIVYVIMTVVYADVPADIITVFAAMLFLGLIRAFSKALVLIERTGTIQEKVIEEEQEDEEKEDEPLEIKVLEKMHTKEEEEQKFLEEKEIEEEIEKKK
jgi:Co/Zn/Cd efflux system component